MIKRLNILLILLIVIITHFACKKDPAGSNDDLIITDIDGNTYTPVIIGDQEWMAENLKVTHYRNGDAIVVSFFPILILMSCDNDSDDLEGLTFT
ncbi:MAG: hypothetical protein HQ551_02230 [Desulfobacteraceae bacterium]|nr:hypothetical protein [Desulfobacteraceae bacterium]